MGISLLMIVVKGAQFNLTHCFLRLRPLTTFLPAPFIAHIAQLSV